MKIYVLGDAGHIECVMCDRCFGDPASWPMPQIERERLLCARDRFVDIAPGEEGSLVCEVCELKTAGKVRPPIRVIFLDLGKTCVGFDLDRFFTWLAKTFAIPRREFWDIFSHYPDGLIFLYEVGMPTPEFIKEFRRRAKDALERYNRENGRRIVYPTFSDHEFLKHWVAILDHDILDREMLLLFAKLKGKGLRLNIISNTNEAHAAEIRTNPLFAPLLRLTDRFFASSDPDVRARKTKPNGMNQKECEEIFRKACAVAGCSPDEAVFIDDIKEFADTFSRMGGNAIVHYGSWTHTEAELAKLGIAADDR